MPAAAALFVSKRLQPPMLALLCLMTAQLLGALAPSCMPEPTPMGAYRVAIGR